MNILIPLLPSHEDSSFETGVGVISLDNLGNPSQQLMALWDLDKQIPLSFHNLLPLVMRKEFFPIAWIMSKEVGFLLLV